MHQVGQRDRINNLKFWSLPGIRARMGGRVVMPRRIYAN